MRTRLAMVLAFLLLAFCASNAWSAPTAAPAAKPTNKPAATSKPKPAKIDTMAVSAPADEYFGKMKLSFLGINNTFRDQAIRAGDQTINPSVIGPVGWAEDALRAWAKKYGKDPQLARTYYLAFLVDRKIWLADFQQRATTYLVLLSSKFPTTFFGKQAKADLAKGMTMNFYLRPMPCDTAAAAAMAPSPIPSADPKHNIKVNPIAVPCFVVPSPTPTPSLPAPMPEATAMPSALSSPTPFTTASPSPLPTNAPSPIPSAPTH